MFLKPEIKLSELADHIKRLSDFFIDHPEQQTPWSEKYCQLAYRHYYLPLNYIRNEKVIERGLQVGFYTNINTSVDWGSGPGTASLALAKINEIENQVLIEKNKDVEKYFNDLKNHLKLKKWTSKLSLENLNLNYKKSLLCFSYSLTEMSELPNGWDQFEALMILEPSTQQDGRKLNQYRELLIKNGYTIWAPCTHQKSCPLIYESKNDWCHDRFHVKAPDWFLELEQKLPFKNKTVTTSYLLARKSQPAFDFKNKARLTGDSLLEKGKTRQLLCRSEKREFLTWMHKEIEPETLPRGDLIELKIEYILKSNEIRLKKHVIV